MECGLKYWPTKVDLTKDEKWELERIGNALIADGKGFFNRAKLLIKEHNLDYKKFYKMGLPYVEVKTRKFWNKS